MASTDPIDATIDNDDPPVAQAPPGPLSVDPAAGNPLLWTPPSSAVASGPRARRGLLERAFAAQRHTPDAPRGRQPASAAPTVPPAPAPAPPSDDEADDDPDSAADSASGRNATGDDTACATEAPAVKRRCVDAAPLSPPLITPRPPPSRLQPDDGNRPSRAMVAPAASHYLVPALHAAALRLDPFFDVEPVWRNRLHEAAADYEAWRAECVDSAELPSWTSLSAAVGGLVGDTLLRSLSRGYIPAADQEALLCMADGVLPQDLAPLQRWANSRLQFASSAPAAADDRPRCPYCSGPTAATSDAVTCSGLCGQRWHRGCVLVSTRRMDNPARWAAEPGRRAWRCVMCTLATAPAPAGPDCEPAAPRPPTGRITAATVTPAPPPTDRAAAAPVAPPATRTPAQRRYRPARPAGDSVRVPAANNDAAVTHAAPEGAAASGDGDCGPRRDFDTTALVAAIAALTPHSAWEWVSACCNAQPGPPRRYLPGGVSRTGPPFARRAAVATAAIVLQAAVDGSPAAQILSLYLPRVFFRRGVEIPAQVADFVAGRRPPPSSTTRTPPDAALRLRQWCARLARAQDAGDFRSAARILETGPEDTAWPEASKDDWLARLFPHQPDGEVADEAERWRDAAAGLAAAAPYPALSAKDVVRWARARRAKAADHGGWSGQVILDLCSSDLHAGVATLLARLWGAPPSAWVDAGARAAAFRSATGILLRQAGKDKPRPIAAPSIPRRIMSAVDARRARPLADAYCVARGQVGLSYGGPLAAYSVFPRLVVALGGTTCSADNTSSFQTFTRRGLVDGLTAALTSAEAAAHPEAAASLARLMSHYVMDAPGLPRTATSFVCGRTAVSHALAQGCSSSPTAEALVLASAPQLVQPVGSIRRCAHDDSQASIMPDADITGLAVPPPWGGARYNVAKSVAVGPRAAEAVANGFAATAATHASVFGAPVGDVAGWAREVWLPRWLRTCANLRRAAETAPDTAVLAANMLRGPGTSASHWLRLAPCDDATREVLVEADSEWVCLWLEFAGYRDGAAISDEMAVRCADRLFGAGSDCFGHLSAADVADARYWAGAALAWPTVAAWAADLRSPAATPDTMARAMGVPSGVVEPAMAHNDPDRLVGIISAWLRSRATLEDERLTLRRNERREHIASGVASCDHGAHASASAVSDGSPNLLLAALRDSAWALAGPLSADGAGAPIIVARIFGLPVWPALAVPPPSQCRRCNASAYSCPCEAGGPTRETATTATAALPPRPRLRADLDPHGDHFTACLKAGPAAGAKWRHDNFARDLAKISCAVGRGGQYHDGPVFDFGRRRRPADIMEEGNLCIDLTIGARQVQTAAGREAEKTAKYADQMRVHPDLRFSPFAVDLDGEVGPAAASILSGWSRALATIRRRAGVPTGDPTADVAVAVGRAFTRGLIAQAVAWLGQTRGVT